MPLSKQHKENKTQTTELKQIYSESTFPVEGNLAV